ncbi:MAG: M50 family metallopeptidase [Clostridiales bacterium]|jgi:regulator of sigma E protease|nr:M50 family metallopeptidase [Clostridiales bacterium]
MSIFITIICTIIIFSLLIFIHELGHFLAARAFNVKVNKFAIGMGPALLKWGKGETEYSIRLFPIGGYAEMEGEDEDSNNPRAFTNAKPYQKIIILAAGAFFNLLSGFLLCVIVMGSIAKVPVPIIKEVIPGSAIEQAGLASGDQIIAIDGHKTKMQSQVNSRLARSNGEPIDVLYKRNGELYNVNITPQFDEAQGRYLLGFYTSEVDNNLGNAFVFGWNHFTFVTTETFTNLKDLVLGKLGFDQVSGPVGIVSAIGGSVDDVVDNESYAIQNLIGLFLLISISLGVFNILPFPALDGGRIIFAIIEAIIRKPVPIEKEAIVHAIGFALLIILVLFVTGHDIMRLVNPTS